MSLRANNMSKSFQFGSQDWKRIGKGALVAIAGALVIYIPQAVTEISWGAYAPFATAIAGILVNILRVWATDNTK